MRKLLFVCSGNTCRSPLALAAWRALAEAAEAPKDIEVSSAGLMASDGGRATRHTIEIAREWKQDLSSHRAQMLEPKTASEADWIVVMNSSHVFVLRQLLEKDSQKVLMLGRFDAENGDEEILDPFGGSREGYETCAVRIRRAVGKLAQAIENDTL